MAINLAAVRKRLMNKRIAVFLVLVVLAELFFFLDKQAILNIPAYLINIVKFVVFVLAVLLTISIILRFTSSRVYRAFEDEIEIEQRIFLSKIYSFFLYTLGLALILWKAGVSPGNLTLFLGLVTTGVAFAVRDVLMTVLAWIIILTKRPVKMHDNIKIGDDFGEITRIGTFYITLQTSNDPNNVVKIPNKLFLEKSIANYGQKRKLFTIKLQINKIPADIENRLSTLRSKLNNVSKDKESVSIKIDSDGGAWVIIINLIGEASAEDLHNKILLLGYNIFEDLQMKDKSKEI